MNHYKKNLIKRIMSHDSQTGDKAPTEAALCLQKLYDNLHLLITLIKLSIETYSKCIIGVQ